MAVDLEAGGAAEGVDGPLQRLVGEGRHPPALVADQVVVMLIWIESLVPRRVGADVDPLDQVKLLEPVQGAVDAGPPGGEPPVHLQRRQGAILGRQQRQHLLARGAATAARLVQFL